MHRLAFLALMVFVVAGCETAAQKELSKGPDVPNYDGLRALNNQELLQPILMGAAMGNMAAVKQQVAKPEFVEAFGKFESEAIPSKYSTPEREAARTDAIKHFKALIDGVKSGASDSDLKASAEAANKALQALSAPPPTK
jgi:hypothetical protein